MDTIRGVSEWPYSHTLLWQLSWSPSLDTPLPRYRISHTSFLIALSPGTILDARFTSVASTDPEVSVLLWSGSQGLSHLPEPHSLQSWVEDRFPEYSFHILFSLTLIAIYIIFTRICWSFSSLCFEDDNGDGLNALMSLDQGLLAPFSNFKCYSFSSICWLDWLGWINFYFYGFRRKNPITTWSPLTLHLTLWSTTVSTYSGWGMSTPGF